LRVSLLRSANNPSRCFSDRVSGQPISVASVNPEYDDSPNDTGGADDTLRPMEALDADDVRNADGDEVVDPPDHWVAADHIAEEPDGETLDEKLAAEEPEALARPSDEGVQMDRINPDDHGTDQGQVSGTPEDGDSLFPVVD
jgi:hypothetical protein